MHKILENRLVVDVPSEEQNEEYDNKEKCEV